MPPKRRRTSLSPDPDTSSPATRRTTRHTTMAIHSDLVAPEITYHNPQAALRPSSSLVRPHGPSATPPPPPRLSSSKPGITTPGPASRVSVLGTPGRTGRNIDKVVLGNLCFPTWYPSYYGKELLGDASFKGVVEENNKATVAGVKKEGQPPLDRLYVCPNCFKYSKELVTWWRHTQVCESIGQPPGRKIYVHPGGARKVLVPVPQVNSKGLGPKRRKAEGPVKYKEETVLDEGEWSIWEVDGEDEGLFCQNLSLFAKLFLDNKSVFFDVTGFNYFLLVYTPPSPPTPSQTPPHPQIIGFFSKEKMSWDNNNLACILVFPPWQRKGLGALLMGASYEISKREGVMGGPEKPISDLGRKGYNRFWAGEVGRWLLGLGEADGEAEVIVDVEEISRATWIATEDVYAVLREMGVVEDAGMGAGKPIQREEEEMVDEKPDAVVDAPPPEPQPDVRRVKIDKAGIRRYIQANRISMERTCDPEGFVEGYAMKQDDADDDEAEDME